VQELFHWVEAQHSPGVLFAAGAMAMLVGLMVLRLVRRVKRLIWSLGVLAVAGGMGAGGGWTALNALTQLR
jgi:hypothetical protein